MLRIVASSLPAETSPSVPDTSRAIAPIDTTGATPIDLELTMDQQGDALSLGINGTPYAESTPIEAMIGDTQVWTVKDAMPWAHPFHLHGFFFQVLEENGAPTSNLEWTDTVHVPVDGSAKLAVRFDERPGMWMFHCHILDHAELGMMGMVHLHE